MNNYIVSSQKAFVFMKNFPIVIFLIDFDVLRFPKTPQAMCLRNKSKKMKRTKNES